jgi:tungstate transport system substrate-binding protein
MRAKGLAAIAVATILAAAGVYWYWLSTQRAVLRVSTTTSLYATGLLDALAEDFRRDHPNLVIQFIAVGSGEALRRAAMGDADVALVHAPSLEKRYIDDGVIAERTIFACNFFVILGPSDDPAGIRGSDPVEAMKLIYEAGERGEAKFVSRGDKSGTHVRELSLWEAAGLDPRGKPWYVETGSGMTETLMVANEMSAYTLSDIGTYLKFRDRLGEIEPLIEGGDALINIYSAYVVTKGEATELAREFVEYLASERAQELIGSFGVAEFGQPLFYPASSAQPGELERAWNRLAGV